MRPRTVACLAGASLLTLAANGMEPVSCPAGAPIGSFQLMVSPASGSAEPRTIQTVNQLLPGYKISYTPAKINSPDKKKARIALVLVPSDKGRILVLDPKPADDSAEWSVPVRTQIVAAVFGPQGLDKGKVSSLVKKNDELVGQLADYAQKTQQTEALIEAVTQQQQTLASGQSVNAAVVSFANQYPNAPKLDPSQSVDAQMATLLRGLNPAISAYDPLATDPSQRAAQSAGIAAAVAGLFFGTNVGLGASAGALLFNMHSMFFPRTEFRSAFGQTVPGVKNVTALCGSRSASASRTQLAFLWATRLPDSVAPAISLAAVEHVPIGVKTSVPLEVKARDFKLAARVQDWLLVSADGAASHPLNARVNTEKKTLELDLSSGKFEPGPWKLAGSWDWSPVAVAGEIDLHEFSTFASARVSPESQDRLTESRGKVVVDLEGADFEFVDKLAFKNCDDKFAVASAVPFILPKGPNGGPQMTMETQVDTASLPAGNYQFLIAQSDGQTHTVPVKVLPAPPQISNLPVLVNTGESETKIVLRGQGLDRIDSLSADGAKITLGAAPKADKREAAVRLDASVKPGVKLTLRVKVKDFDQPIGFPDALVVAGPRPAIDNVQVSLPPDLGVALAPGEIPATSPVSFAFAVTHAANVESLDLSCEGDAAGKQLIIGAGAAAGDARLRQEGPGALFLAFNPASVGQPGCVVMASVHTAAAGDSSPKKLGVITLLPKIESFQLTDQKAGDAAYFGEIKGQNLETIAEVGWDAQTGVPVASIPAPVAGGGNDELLRTAVPWPAPAPHSPLYIWLRGETAGRATTAKW